MDKEPGIPEDKPKPPPPDLPKSKAPPPSPPAPPVAPPAAPPPSSPASVPVAPLRVGPSSSADSGWSNDDDEEVPGADATMPNRIIAAVIDGVISVGIIMVVLLLLPNFLPSIFDRVAYLLGLGYFLTRDSLPFLEGQSVGKKAMGIRAVTFAGESLEGNWQPGVVRNVAFLIPPFALVELVVLITRQEKPPPLLRLGDEWAKTKVINAEKPGAVAVSTSASTAPKGDEKSGSSSED